MQFDYVYGRNVESNYPDIKLSIESITPDIAGQMLKANVNNRRMKRESIANDIERGRWSLNGATIVFSDDGVLLDGQNRLQAVISTGKSIETVVVRGVKYGAQISMDSGIKRNASAFLTMRGYPQATLLAAMGSSMRRADILGVASSYVKSGHEETAQDVVEYVIDNYESRIAPIKEHVDDISRKYSGTSRRTLAPLFDAFRACGEDDYICFINQLYMREPLRQPVALLVNKLVENATSKHEKLQQGVIAAYIVKAWNAYMRGVEMKQLKYTMGGAHPEKFPDIYGASAILEQRGEGD